MKIRNGFVSNSSSSSFVLANKTGNTKVMMEVDLSDLFDKTIRSIKELDEYFLDQYSYLAETTLEQILEGDEYAKSQYLEFKKKLEEGYFLFVGDVSNDDDNPLSYYFYQNGFSGIKGFEILDEEC